MSLTIIKDIKSGLESAINTLSLGYTKLAYQTDVKQNKFKGNHKGYSVMPSSSNETDGLIGAYTMNHKFEITYTDSYNAGAASQVGDTLKSSRITEITDDILTTYKYISNNKYSIYSGILLINDLSIEQAEFLDEEKVITIKFSFTVKYKVNK